MVVHVVHVAHVAHVARMNQVVAVELQLAKASAAMVAAPVVLDRDISVARFLAEKAERRIMDFQEYQKVVTVAAVVAVEIVVDRLESVANVPSMAGEEEVAVDAAVSLHFANQKSVETVQDMVVVGLGIAVTVEKQFVEEEEGVNHE